MILNLPIAMEDEHYVHSSGEFFYGDDNGDLPTSKMQRNVESLGNELIVYLMDDTHATISEPYASSDA